MQLNDGLGWALFTDTKSRTIKCDGEKEVVVTAGVTENGYVMGDHIIPSIRIMTNETFYSDDRISILAEDVMVHPSGYSQYYMSAFTTPDETEKDSALLFKTPSPLFIIQDGHLIITTNTPPVTPAYTVTMPGKSSLAPVVPYGDRASSSMVDQFYALEKAELLLSEIAEAVPTYKHQT